MATIPSPIVLPQTRQRDSVIEQLLVSLASQAPNVLLGLLARGDRKEATEEEKRRYEAEQAQAGVERAGAAGAALGSVRGLQAETAGSPELAAILAATTSPLIQGMGNATIPTAEFSALATATAPVAQAAVTGALQRKESGLRAEVAGEELSFARETRGHRLRQVEQETEFNDLRSLQINQQMELAKAADARAARQLALDEQQTRAAITSAAQNFAASSEELLMSRLQGAITARGGAVPPEVARDLMLMLRGGRTPEIVAARFAEFAEGGLSREEFNEAIFGDTFELLGVELGVDPQAIRGMRNFFESAPEKSQQEWLSTALRKLDAAVELGQLEPEQAEVDKAAAVFLLNTWRSANGQRPFSQPKILTEDSPLWREVTQQMLRPENVIRALRDASLGQAPVPGSGPLSSGLLGDALKDFAYAAAAGLSDTSTPPAPTGITSMPPAAAAGLNAFGPLGGISNLVQPGRLPQTPSSGPLRPGGTIDQASLPALGPVGSAMGIAQAAPAGANAFGPVGSALRLQQLINEYMEKRQTLPGGR